MKKNYSSYVRMPKHPNFYQNPTSKKIRFKKAINGTTVIISCKTTSITEAKSFVEKELINIYSNNPQKELKERLGITNPVLDDIWVDVLNEKKPRSEPSTMQSYCASWEHGISPFWKNRTVNDINHPTVLKYENWYLKTNPKRTFFNTRKHLLMLFNYCKAHGYIKEVPEVRKLDEIIDKNSKKEKPGRVYTDAEVKSLIENAASEALKMAILIYRYMGPRKNEILKLEWAKVDFSAKTMNIWSYKNKRWRSVPIPDHVLTHLKIWRTKNSKDKYIFTAPTNKNKYLSSQVLDKVWLKTKVAAKLKDASKKNASRIHDLRHTFATQTALDNWPPMVACQVLDMSLKEYQKTYVHVTHSDIRSMMNRSYEAIV